MYQFSRQKCQSQLPTCSKAARTAACVSLLKPSPVKCMCIWTALVLLLELLGAGAGAEMGAWEGWPCSGAMLGLCVALTDRELV